MENIKALFVIVNAGFSEEIVTIAREHGARGATILNARGMGSSQQTIMGITVDDEREMILILIEEKAAVKIMSSIKANSGVETPAHGICFFMPVENMTAN